MVIPIEMAKYCVIIMEESEEFRQNRNGWHLWGTTLKIIKLKFFHSVTVTVTLQRPRRKLEPCKEVGIVWTRISFLMRIKSGNFLSIHSSIKYITIILQSNFGFSCFQRVMCILCRRQVHKGAEEINLMWTDVHVRRSKKNDPVDKPKRRSVLIIFQEHSSTS